MPVTVLTPMLLVAAANALAGAAGDEGTAAPVSQMLGEVRFNEEALAGPRAERLPRRRWDAALVHHLGYWSHFNLENGTSSWPLPPTGECQELARFARERRALVEVPEPGDIFLMWSPAQKTWTRAGIIMRAEPLHEERGREPSYRCETIEGDTDENLRPGGGKVLRHSRRLSIERGDRFVRWALCDGKENTRAAIRAMGMQRAALNGLPPARSTLSEVTFLEAA